MNSVIKTRLSYLLLGWLILSQSCEKQKESGLPKDMDGNEYDTVVIGAQTWLKENLKTTKYNNGDPIYLVTDNTKWISWPTGAYCWYNNDSKYKDSYGALYNWYAAKTRALCPVGWHVPTMEEWTTLVNYFGGQWEAGCKLKESGASHWTSVNGGNNESGFTALPGGIRYFGDGKFEQIREVGAFWVSDFPYYTGLGSSHCQSQTVATYKESGFSVRCIKDR